MEQEYKWKGTRQLFDTLCNHLSLTNEQIHTMNACYFDTQDGFLQNKKIGLRLRQENGQSICCFKCNGQVNGGCHTHQEYECACDNILQGIEQLMKQGAPVDICTHLLKSPLIEIAKVNFTRIERDWTHADFHAILCFDYGTLANQKAEIPFSEIECEYQTGDFSSFVSACDALCAKFVLLPQPQSKLARALSLSKV